MAHWTKAYVRKMPGAMGKYACPCQPLKSTGKRTCPWHPRRHVLSGWMLLAMLLCLVALPSASARAEAPSFITGSREEVTPEAFKDVGVDEHLGAALPLDLQFEDERGQPVQLRQYFAGNKPVILQLGYYGCPMLCGLVSRGMLETLKDVPLNTGKDFEVVMVSIDPGETSKLAYQKKQAYVKEYDRPEAVAGWHFLTGKQPEIKALTAAVGFQYKWIESAGQFSHPAVLAVCSPEGKITRYLYGVKFEPKTVRLSLVEASAGKVGTTVDRFILTCFQYDGHQGRYAFAAIGLMRVGAALTLIVLGAALWRLFRWERRQYVQSNGRSSPPPSPGVPGEGV